MVLYTNNTKVIHLSECQMLSLLEGISIRPNGDGTFDTSITVGRDDASNTRTKVDTRALGTRDSVLYGDGTDRYYKGMEAEINKYKEYMMIYSNLYRYALNNPNANFASLRGNQLYSILGANKISSKTMDGINNVLQTNDAEAIMQKCQNDYERYMTKYNMMVKTYERYNITNADAIKKAEEQGKKLKRSELPNFVNRSGQEVIPKYYYGYVPNTDIRVISVFKFDDFNVSDILKNGHMRQNKFTDEKLGLKNNREREKINKIYGGNLSDKKLSVTYDNGILPSISNNFSYSDDSFDERGNVLNKDHFGRKNMEGNYTSQAQFIDKSIMGAALAIRKEHIDADFIVSAPSSSKFNDFYCNRLSHKTGIPYIQGFFKRNVINAEIDEEAMMNDGYGEDEIDELKRKIVAASIQEIIGEIAKPIDYYVKTHRELSHMLYNPHKRGRRTANDFVDVDRNDLATVIKSYITTSVIESIRTNNDLNALGSYIIDSMANYYDSSLNRYTVNGVNYSYVVQNIAKKVQGDTTFLKCVQYVTSLIKQYSQKLLEGYKPNLFEQKKFKIVDIKFSMRKYVQNAYVIADKNFNENYELMSRYKNGKFILFDEDMNSGATLKILVDAMAQYGIRHRQVICLVNAYKLEG